MEQKTTFTITIYTLQSNMAVTKKTPKAQEGTKKSAPKFKILAGHASAMKQT